MSDPRIYKTFALFISVVLLVSACGTAQQSAIATSVAQTVQAGESLTQMAGTQAAIPTTAPTSAIPSLDPTLSAASTPTTAATLVSAPGDPNCAKAALISENPPDGVLLKPGEYFWKTWTLQNTGTCTWTSAYKLIYWSGDLLGGLTSYPLPVEVAPNEQKDITIYLQAPATDGTFTGYWRLQTPWESNFGVGPSDEPFYVAVAVSSATKVKYGVTGVSYELVRTPPTGCPTNVRYEVFATITTNGPAEVHYRWNQSDGNESGVKRNDFTEAGSITVSREWMIGKGDSPNPRWMQIIISAPSYQEFGKVEILNNCP
jgi:hypothetical protein